jgi:hypothetical protein
LLRTLVVTVALLLGAGSALLSQPARLLRFSVIQVKASTELAEPSAYVIRGNDEWKRFLAERLGHSGGPPAVDFRSATVVAIFGGLKPTGGYSVRVDRVTDESRAGEASRATIHYRVVAPPPDALVTQALTYPFIIVRVAKKLDSIAFQPPIQAPTQ